MSASEHTSLPQPAVREVQCKSILSESGICDYSLSCYRGCSHACTYCYARFMGRFHHPGEAWGSFVDAKVNAPEVLANRLSGAGKLFSPGSVFVSSVCDPYQPAEEQHRLTRQCLELLLDAGFRVYLQTKSDLVRRDFDILAGRDNVSLCETITTMDKTLAEQIEPAAASPAERLETLRLAAEAGIPIKAFVGPLLPGITDTPDSLGEVFGALAPLDVDEVYVDRLNLRWGVWPATKAVFEQRHSDESLAEARKVLFDPAERIAYGRRLRPIIDQAADSAGVASVLNVVF